ncbi:MAG: AI-2E family transporter, partial [Bacteroidia bacterium]
MRVSTNIWRIIPVIILITLSIVFLKIVVYILISAVLFLIGYPITKKLQSIKIGKNTLPDWIASLLTILFLLIIISSLFFLILPPLIKQADVLSGLNFYDVLHNLLLQFPSLNNLIASLGNLDDFKLAISNQLKTVLNFTNFSLILNNLFSYLGTIVGGTLCVLFITFFFLKDERLLKESILAITPNESEENIKEILHKSKVMLSKYFGGLFIDMLIVATLATTLLSLFGIQNALIIGVAAGLFNVVPYIGSAITMCIAIFLGVSACIVANEYALISITITKIFFTLLSINLLDGFLIQPFIYSNSVKAHPLEIFIVVLMGATLKGIPGMIIALPSYTFLRIVAKE